MRENDDQIVITGIAPVSALGHGVDRCWDALVDGVCGLAPITRFDTTGFPVKLAGEVRNEAPERWLDRRLLVATDRWTQLGMIAAQHALAEAGVDLGEIDPYRVAVITAAGSGGNEFGQREIQSLWSSGPRTVTVYQSIAWFYAATTGQISIRHGSKGMCGVVAGGGAAGLDIFGQAMRALATGTDVALIGATEAGVSPYALTCQFGSGLLSSGDDPKTAYQPFGAGASGYVIGEGGAMFVLERADHCRDRGATPLAVVSGHAASHDGRRARSTDDAVRAGGLAEAIRSALARAGLDASDIGVVVADGAGVPELDRAEAAALELVFSDRETPVPVTVTKAATGRMEAASACFDVFAATRTTTTGIIPPTANAASPDFDLDLVASARPHPVDHALVVARGHGGFNAALVLSTPNVLNATPQKSKELIDD
jgi:3-oxoacyl-(acyl-carrier-protein) synthase